MASTNGLKGKAESVGSLQRSAPPNFGITCHRCGGLMVREFCADLMRSTGDLDFLASRCIQCGEIIDPIILQNRRRLRKITPESGVLAEA